MCIRDSKRDFSRAYSSLEELDEINFFKSRFFSAVDIELPTTACVLIVTDLSFAAHTVIDLSLIHILKCR